MYNNSGSGSGNGTVFPFKTKIPITLKAGKNEIALLSLTVGLQVSLYGCFLSHVHSYIIVACIACHITSKYLPMICVFTFSLIFS